MVVKQLSQGAGRRLSISPDHGLDRSIESTRNFVGASQRRCPAIGDIENHGPPVGIRVSAPDHLLGFEAAREIDHRLRADAERPSDFTDVARAMAGELGEKANLAGSKA